jgi:hypothetical protein
MAQSPHGIYIWDDEGRREIDLKPPKGWAMNRRAELQELYEARARRLQPEIEAEFGDLLFALVNLAVIIMRESLITSYAPEFRSPWYPWIQIFGVVSTVALLVTLGVFYVAFVGAIAAGSAIWYRYYAYGKVVRRGAIYSLFLRLGRHHDQGVDQ